MPSYNQYTEIQAMKGVTFDRIVQTDDQLSFYENDEPRFVMYHSQDCCENVTIEDICGDLDDLIGSPILEAECVTDTDSPKTETYGNKGQYSSTDESSTWTFYKLGTRQGHVTIRWYGSSNGYYSEGVDIADMKKGRE